MPRTWSLPTLPKATVEDALDPVLGWTAQHTQGPSHLQPYSISKTANSRTDTATVSSGSSTITDASIALADFGKQVSGAGIPANSYVGTVTAGTSFVLSSNPYVSTPVLATAAGTSVIIGANVYPWHGAGTYPSSLSAPTVSTSTTGGTALVASTLYSYAFAFTTQFGESVLSAVGTVTTGAGSTNSNTVTPPAIPVWATGVNIYGRVGGALTLLRNQATAAAWVDTGVADATANGHSHSGRNEAAGGTNH